MRETELEEQFKAARSSLGVLSIEPSVLDPLAYK